MAVQYRKMTEKDVDTFIELRIPQRKDRTAFQHVHRGRLPQTGHRKRTVDAGGKRSEGLWMWLRPDHGFRYGGAAVHGFRVCKKWQFYAVQVLRGHSLYIGI